MQQNTLIRIATLFITVVLVVLLLSQVSLEEVALAIISIHPVYLAGGFILYLCTYILRSFRFSLLLNRTIRIRDLLPITAVHVMMNNLLPARTGELSYVYLLKKMHKRSTGEGVATLVVARVFDFIMIILLLFGAGLFISDIPQAISDVLWLVYILLFCLLAFLIALVSSGWFCMRLIRRVLTYLRWDVTRGGDYLLRKGMETVESFDRIDMRLNVVPILISSFVLWLCNFGALYLIVAGMGISLPFQTILFGGTFLLLASVLPIHGVAGFGTTEAIWTLVYVPLGMSVNEAIISGFGYHIVLLIYTTIIGGCGSLLLRSHPFGRE